MNKYKNLNLKYALVNAAYLMLVVATAGYGYNYLSQCGFQDGTVGIIITLISIFGLVCQTGFGQVIDQSKTLTEKKFISITMIVTIILSVILTFVPDSSFLTIPLVIVAFTSAAAGMPFLNSLAFIYEKDGQSINYGLGRGIGSAAYAVGSSLLGTLWGQFGNDVLPIYIIAFSAATFLLVQIMPAPSEQVEAEEHQEEQEKTESLSYGAFFKKYTQIILPVVGMICLYFCHMIVNTYMAKVIGNIVPNASSVEGYQGTAMFIQAMAELPAMFAFALLIKKFGIHKILSFAAIVYSIKHILILFCPNVTALYGIMILQMFSYALLIPGGVYLSNEVVAPQDRNKGQAIMAATATVGGLFASLVGGQLFQFMSVTSVLTIATVVSVIGTILMLVGIGALKKN